jgi:AraC-like DNA-binding protein
MPKAKKPGTGWATQELDPSVQHLGLPYFPGKKVSVSLGRLASSMWGEHWSNRLRLIFTFNKAFGHLEATSEGRYGDSSWYMGPHEFCLVAPGVGTTFDWVTPAELLILYVEPSALPGQDARVCASAGFALRPLPQRDRCLIQLANVFLTSCREVEAPAASFFEGTGIALASRALAQSLLPDPSGTHTRSALPPDVLEQVILHIEANLSGAIMARDLARRVGLSPDHFARRFKVTTRMGPKQYVLKRRVEKVHELLASGRYNVTEAGREVGFHDLSHLNRCFRSVFGYSPKAALKNPSVPDSDR